MGILIPLLLIAFCCLIIWRAGDAFMVASEYVGRNLSDGVRGATINAIASSMPEVFTSIFFLFVLDDSDGFSGGVGTTAGSAIFNIMIIPSVAVLAVIGMGLVKKVKVSKRVVWRDGIALIIAEIIFLVFVSESSLYWYHGVILMLSYFIYIFYMFRTMKKNEVNDGDNEEETFEVEPKPFFTSLITFDLAHLFIRKKINSLNAWMLLIASTLAMAGVCYFLVLACDWIGAETYSINGLGTFHGLNIPVMFVALILASAASSFPDTVISIKDARNGQYDDAISNALGSNIFDICFSLGFPLFLYTIISGPIQMSPEVIFMSTELRVLLLILTVVAVFIFLKGDYFAKPKSYIMLGLYVLFVVYIVGRANDNALTNYLADIFVGIMNFFRF